MKTGLAMVAVAAALAGCGGGETAADRAGEGDQVVVNGEDGRTVIRTGESAGRLPGGLPGYPGAETQGGIDIVADSRDGGQGAIVTFRTDDPPDRVIAFYREAAEARGYRIAATMDLGQTQTIAAERGDGEGGLQVSATDTGMGTQVSVIAGANR